MKVSHSKINKYLTCPRLYHLHYDLRLRELQLSSALFFGSAVDEALNCFLLRKKKELTGQEKIQVALDPKVVFEQQMESSNYNQETLYLKKSLLVRYFATDYVPEILEHDDFFLLTEYLKENGYENTNGLEVMEETKAFIKSEGFYKLPKVDQIFYNYANWLSLRRKGFHMLDAFERDLYPLIDEVISIQKEVDLRNGEDSMTGFIDFVAKLKGENFARIIDNKTAGKKYDEDSVETSPQLTVYAEFEKLENAAYFIMLKKPKFIRHKTCQICGVTTTGAARKCDQGGTGKKRCNGDFDVLVTCEFNTQKVLGEITEEQKDLTFNEIADIMDKIKAGEFPKIDRKGCFHFGKKCIGYKRCWEDPENMLGLVKLGEL